MTTPAALHPDALGQRIDALGANGHAWMDGPTMLSLASAPTTDAQMLTQASALTSAAQAQTAATPLATHDPVDAVPYSSTSHLVQTVHSIVGTPKLSATDISSVQTALANHGYATGLTGNGVWSSDWQSAYSQFAADARSRGYQGEHQLFTERTKGVISHILNAASASGGLGSLWGFVKSIPHDLRQVVGDTIGATEGLGSYVGREVQGAFTGTAYSAQGQKSIFGSAEHDALTGSGFIEGKTAEQQHQAFTDENGDWSWGRVGGRFIDNLGSALLVLPVADALGATIKGATVAADTAGQIGVRGALKQAVVLGDKEAARKAPGLLVRKIVQDGDVPGLLNSRAIQNVPLLSRVGPVLSKALDAEGGYYRVRSALATPYRIPLVRAAGNAYTKGLVLGAEARGVGALSTVVGGDPNAALNYDVAHSDIDPYVVRLGFLKPLGLDSALNDLGLLLHPSPVKGAGVGAEQVANQIDSAYQTYSRFAGGPISPVGAFERAINGARKVAGQKPLSHEQIVEGYGGEDHFLAAVQEKVDQHAAAAHAQRLMDAGAADGIAPEAETSAEGSRWLYDKADEIQGDRALMTEAHSLFLGHESEMEARFRREMTATATQLDNGPGPGAAKRMDALFALRQITGDPALRSELITPESFRLRQSEIDNAPPAFSPDATATQIKPTLTAEFLREQNLNQDRGRIGVAKPDTMTIQPALRWMKRMDSEHATFQARLAEATDPTHAAAIRQEQDAWLHQQIHDFAFQSATDGGTLSSLLSTASGEAGYQGLVAKMKDWHQMLASDVYLPADASPATRAAFAKVKAAGYKVVYGKGIGHASEMPVDPVELGNAINRRQKIMGSLLLSPQRTSQLTVGAMWRINAEARLQQAMDAKRLSPYLSDLLTPRNIFTIATHGFGEEPLPSESLTIGEKTSRGLASPLLKRQAKQALLVEGRATQVEGRFGGLKIKAAPADVDAKVRDMEKTMVATLGLRDLRRPAIVEALQDPARYPWLTQGEDGLRLPDGSVPGVMSKADANLVADIVIRSAADRPAYMLGGQHLEDLFRSGMGFLGSKLQYNLPAPLESVASGMARLPNRYYQTMTRLRFRLSPYFDLRRVTKTNVKFALAGIRPVADPGHALLAEGGVKTWQDAHALLDKVWPESKMADHTWLDANDQILANAGVWGLYNPRHFAAWAAHDLNRQGKSLSEIRATLDKTMTYGDRTALERTANTVFFPFSFDKTLYRSLGGYMLDHPSQSLIMLRAFQAYDQFSQDHPGDITSYKWWQEHAPVLGEANRMNAFAHGIGPGELGGINAPLLNAFLPQSIPATAAGHALLKRLIPAITDINRVATEIQQTGVGSWHGAQQGLYKAEVLLGQRKATPLNAPPSAIAGQYALPAALDFKKSLSDALQSVLTYNQKHPNGRYTWPVTDQVPSAVRGQPIDSTTISLIVQHRFPTYNPAKAVEIAQAKKLDVTKALGDHADDPTWSGVASFSKQVNSLAAHISADDRPTAALAAASRSLRDYALQMSEADPTFAALYDKAWSHILGPRQMSK